MINAAVLPFMRKTMESRPTLINIAATATSLMRQMAIKPFTPRKRERESSLLERSADAKIHINPIFKEKGDGDIPTIVIGGFVPDSTELVEFQRPLFRNYGSIYYINYSRRGFSTEMFFAQLADLVEDLNSRGKRPVIFSVSFGSGLLASFLREHADGPLKIRGVVMASPVLCTEDLIRTEKEKSGGVRMLESNLRRILRADAGNPEDVGRHIERARRCFQSLFETGAENRRLSTRHLSIRKKIMAVVENTPALGGYERVQALSRLQFPSSCKPVFCGPALTLLAEMEENLLVPSSPTLAAFKDPETQIRLFPRGKVKTIISRRSGDAVGHASLIFHQHCYNPLIEAWYDKLTQPRLFAVV